MPEVYACLFVEIPLNGIEVEVHSKSTEGDQPPDVKMKPDC